MLATIDTTLLDTALGYAGRGWPVIPLYPTKNGICTCEKGPGCENSAGKHPWIADWRNQASTSPGQIRKWWRARPLSNIGIVTGQASGILLLDIDGDPGRESVKSQGELPETPLSNTGRGHHVLFAYPTDSLTTKNRAGFLPGLDIRGDGGLFVAPPSRHYSGSNYAWIKAPGEIPLAPCPAWLVELLKDKKPVGQVIPFQPKTSQGQGKSYGATALVEECEKVRTAPNGTRNSTLNKAAYALGQLVAGGELGQYEAESELERAAAACGLNRAEIKTTIASGMGDGIKNPRSAPPRPVIKGTSRNDLVDQETGEITGTSQDSKPTRARTDMGNAERLIDWHGENIRYCDALGWLVWNGRQWVEDTTNELMRMAKATVRHIYGEAEASEQVNERKALADHAKNSESKSKLEAMIALAKSEKGIPVAITDFDADPWLLNVHNGTIDLKTGQLMPHRRTDLLKRLADFDYNPQAECPTWLTFLNKVFHGDKDLIKFIQQAVGYSLTGLTNEQCFFLLYGTGRNGKSTFLETIKQLLGSYAKATSFNTFLEKQGDSVRNDLAGLAGARFVAAKEAARGKRLDEQAIKELTGGDTISARFLHKEYFEYQPQFKIWLAANHKPQIRGQDIGIWRRVRLIPFEVQIAENEIDYALGDKLKAELPGILAWAVRGCVTWKSGRLVSPAKVLAATEEYRTESDRLHDFLAEACVKGKKKQITLLKLFKGYEAWCRDNEERPIGKASLKAALTERNYHIATASGNYVTVYGLDLAPIGSQPVEAENEDIFSTIDALEWGEK